jgi:hypothetical protein
MIQLCKLVANPEGAIFQGAPSEVQSPNSLWLTYGMPVPQRLLPVAGEPSPQCLLSII